MKHSALKRISIVLSFLAVFAVIFYLLNFDFGGLKKSLCGPSDPSARETFDLPDYWLEKYGIQLKSQDDLQIDADNDGLSLADEYKYFTNPLDSDTDKDGYKDGEEVKAGYNPIGLGKMDINRDGLPDYWEQENGLSLDVNEYDLDPDRDGLPNYLEFRHGTDPQKADTDGDGFNDSNEIRHGYDPSQAGEARPDYAMAIPKIGITVPVIWSKSASESDLQADLKNGAVRYPQTAIPGQSGNIVVSGHSSNYVWADGKYNYVFKDLNELKDGDEIVLTATQANGKILEYKYAVSAKAVVAPDDPKIFEETPKQEITLVTCWPLNTDWKRLVVQAEQTD
jgi:LPXTG-site transpeptidase (sortase) family protein